MQGKPCQVGSLGHAMILIPWSYKRCTSLPPEQQFGAKQVVCLVGDDCFQGLHPTGAMSGWVNIASKLF